jgi:hypothetical protein
MKKFVVHTPRGSKSSIMEVELELITATEDPSIQWLPEGEYRARVLAPASLSEKQDDGSLQAPVWHSYMFYWNVTQAWVYAEKMIRTEMKRDMEKHHIEYTEDDVKARLAEIKEVLL